jgi:SAM-dependent methyltransferase
MDEGVPGGPRLNIGAGWDRRPGFVNLDLAAIAGVDVVADLEGSGLPFPTGTFGLVLCRDVLEHVDVVPALEEVHRVTAPGGAVVVSAVHYTSRNLYVDPTHRRGFSARTFDYFVPGAPAQDRSYYFDFGFSRVETHLQFSSRLGKGRYLVWDRIVEPLVNRRPSFQDLYEMTAASRAFPAANVLSVLWR